MRELKFRQFYKGRMEGFGFIDKYGGRIFVSPVNPDNDKFPVMQFTGLNDKNGVDIYEDDIATCHGYTGCLIVKHSLFDECCTVSQFSLCDLSGNVVFSDFDRVEIIGNIHQTPELLK